MTETHPRIVRIPTDPTPAGVLLLTAVAAFSQLTTDQAQALAALLGLATALNPYVSHERR
ncbi:hypothetical protein [Streptomyces chilikensis]|uniref:Uncharacterized protein n=1 Tax=Streptomyces chilikensis TaxID=1194079 RepID=A0ABV3ERI6_9ACTN